MSKKKVQNITIENETAIEEKTVEKISDSFPKVYENSYYCLKCGKRNYIDNNYCVECGYPSPYFDDDAIDTDKEYDDQYAYEENIETDTETINRPTVDITKLLIIATIVILMFIGIYIVSKPHNIYYVDTHDAINNNKVKFAYVDEPFVLNDISKDGYYFLGWYEDSNYTKPVSIINTKTLKDITIYARWEEIEYEIIYELDGGTNNWNNPSYYTVSDGTVHLENPSKDDYTFDGWKNAYGIKVTEIDCDTMEPIYLQATWVAKQHTIRYMNVNGAANSNPTKVTCEDYIALADLENRRGYVFTGWFLDSGLHQETYTLNDVRENLTLYAKWKLQEYTLYLDDGLNTSSRTFNINSGSIRLDTLTRDGYRFLGWYDEYGTKYSSLSCNSLARNISLEAKWEANTYTITYKNAGSSNNNPSTYTTDDLIYLSDLYKEGYDFDGWYLNGDQVSYIDGSWKRNVTLEARFTKIINSGEE